MCRSKGGLSTHITRCHPDRYRDRQYLGLEAHLGRGENSDENSEQDATGPEPLRSQTPVDESTISQTQGGIIGEEPSQDINPPEPALRVEYHPYINGA